VARSILAEPSDGNNRANEESEFKLATGSWRIVLSNHGIFSPRSGGSPVAMAMGCSFGRVSLAGDFRSAAPSFVCVATPGPSQGANDCGNSGVDDLHCFRAYDFSVDRAARHSSIS